MFDTQPLPPRPRSGSAGAPRLMLALSSDEARVLLAALTDRRRRMQRDELDGQPSFDHVRALEDALRARLDRCLHDLDPGQQP